MKKLANKNSDAFTLIELLVTMALVAVLAVIAVPSFNSLIKRNQQTAVLNSYLNALSLARSEAVKRSIRVTVCSSGNGASCSSAADWHDGWLVFVDTNSNNVIDSGEELVRVGQALDAGISFLGSTDVASFVRYDDNGDANETGTLTMCDSRGADYAKAVIVTASGRPKISETAAGGAALTCS